MSLADDDRADPTTARREWAPQLPAPQWLRHVLRRVLLITSLASLFVAWDLLVGKQGSCVSFCTPAFRATVLCVVAGGSALLAFTVAARRSAMLLLVLTCFTLMWAALRLH
ncbi:MAG: hypothetical protein H7123_05690 [Thermoleophilia bacterium]|nr:hypothetical protein [Thermoleophilia bacterium]